MSNETQTSDTRAHAVLARLRERLASIERSYHVPGLIDDYDNLSDIVDAHEETEEQKWEYQNVAHNLALAYMDTRNIVALPALLDVVEQAEKTLRFIANESDDSVDRNAALKALAAIDAALNGVGRE